MNDRPGQLRGDLDGRMLSARGGAADQQRHGHLPPLHLARDHHHLVERRRDQAAQANHVRVPLDCGVKNLRRGNHHAEVDHLVVVAAEHHADDVLADVVNVPLDRRHDDPALRAPGLGIGLEPQVALFFHERLEVGHGLFHRAGALHHLRQEHLAGAEQVADDLHAVHQRPFDDVERPPVLLSCFFGVLLDVLDRSMHERVRQTFLDRRVAPRDVLFPFLAGSLHRVGKLHETLGRVRPPVEDHILDVLEQILRDVLVHDELPGVDDAHVHAGLDRVEEERRVHGLAHDVVAAKRERQVADAAADLHSRARRLDEARGLDVVHGVVVVLLEARGDREDVGIEDDVRRIEAGALGQQLVGALADLRPCARSCPPDRSRRRP